MKKIKSATVFSIAIIIILILSTTNNKVASNKSNDYTPIDTVHASIFPQFNTPTITFCSFNGINSYHLYTFWQIDETQNKHSAYLSMPTTSQVPKFTSDYETIGEFGWSQIFFLLFCTCLILLGLSKNSFSKWTNN